MDAYVLGFSIVSVMLDWRGHRGNNIFVNTSGSLIFVFAAIGIGSALGGFLWIILTLLASMAFLSILDKIAGKVFNRHTSVLIKKFTNSGEGMLTSLILNSLFIRIVLIDMFCMPYSVYGFI